MMFMNQATPVSPLNNPECCEILGLFGFVPDTEDYIQIRYKCLDYILYKQLWQLNSFARHKAIIWTHADLLSSGQHSNVIDNQMKYFYDTSLANVVWKCL